MMIIPKKVQTTRQITHLKKKQTTKTTKTTKTRIMSSDAKAIFEAIQFAQGKKGMPAKDDPGYWDDAVGRVSAFYYVFVFGRVAR